MTHVKLMGELGEKFGTDWQVNCPNIRDIFRLIDCQTDGFNNYLLDCHEKNISFAIENSGDLLSADELFLNGIPKDTLIITPVPAGAKKGWAKLVLAAVIYVVTKVATGGAAPSEMAFEIAGMEVTYGQLASVGYSMATSMAMTGITQLTTQTPDGTTGDDSYLFDGVNNAAKAGEPVPVAYGELIVGGTLMSQGFTTQKSKNWSGFWYADDSLSDWNDSYYDGDSGGYNDDDRGQGGGGRPGDGGGNTGDVQKH